MHAFDMKSLLCLITFCFRFVITRILVYLVYLNLKRVCKLENGSYMHLCACHTIGELTLTVLKAFYVNLALKCNVASLVSREGPYVLNGMYNNISLYWNSGFL